MADGFSFFLYACFCNIMAPEGNLHLLFDNELGLFYLQFPFVGGYWLLLFSHFIKTVNPNQNHMRGYILE